MGLLGLTCVCGPQVISLGQYYLISSIGCSQNMFLHWAHFLFRSFSPWTQVTDSESVFPQSPAHRPSPSWPTSHLVQGELSLKDPILHQILEGF